MMTKEELLKPRWKVIANFPYTYYKVGEIIGDTFRLTCEDYIKHNCSEYPAIFQKLEWYEEKQLEQLPLYIRKTSTGDIYKVIDWFKPSTFVCISLNEDGNRYYQLARWFEPATKQEYEEWSTK